MFLVKEFEFNTNTYTSKTRREFEMYLSRNMVLRFLKRGLLSEHPVPQLNLWNRIPPKENFQFRPIHQKEGEPNRTYQTEPPTELGEPNLSPQAEKGRTELNRPNRTFIATLPAEPLTCPLMQNSFRMWADLCCQGCPKS